MATTTQLMTAAEYLLLDSTSGPTELVRGVVVEINPPGFRHGYLCVRLSRLLGDLADELQLGRVIRNDSGVITEHDPDTVRGPDVAFYSFAAIPPDLEPVGYPSVPPELACEVLFPSDRPGNAFSKVSEYLNAGVQVVLVVVPDRREVQVYRINGSVQVLTAADVVSLPELHARLEFPVARLFGAGA